MSKAFLILLWLFSLPAFASADVDHAATQTDAQTAVALAAKALDQASAWENLSRRNLEDAKQALARKPKSAEAKQAVELAQKELDSALAYKAATNAELQEKTAIAASASKTTNKAIVTGGVTIYPEGEYQPFFEENDTAEKVDTYFFFMDPLSYQDKTVILDAKFAEMNSSGEAKFVIWRNFGQMPLTVSNVPSDNLIQKDKTVLLAGVITGFKKEVVSDKFVITPLLKLNSACICINVTCTGVREQLKPKQFKLEELKL